MKKIMAMLVAGMIGTGSTFAAIDISIIVQDTAGVYDPSAGVGPYGGFPDINLAAGSLYQLVWTTAGSASAIDPDDPTSVGASEILLESWFSTVTGFLDTQTGNYDSTLYALASDGLVPGRVYGRVFNSAAPDGVAGFYAGVTDLVGGPLNDQSPTAGAQNTVEYAAATPIELTFYQVVPEPSVLAFLGIGAALVAVRRMRRS